MTLSLVVIAASCGKHPVAPPAASIAELEDRIERLRASSHIPAVTAVIAKGQEIVWIKGFGTADLATNRPAADTTIYHLASLTKPFASTVILQLVDEGKVSLDDPISTYGINLPSSGTIRCVIFSVTRRTAFQEQASVTTATDSGSWTRSSSARPERRLPPRCPYTEEWRSLESMHALAEREGREAHGRHHEIYLSDPRRVAPAKLRTILRLPVESRGA